MKIQKTYENGACVIMDNCRVESWLGQSVIIGTVTDYKGLEDWATIGEEGIVINSELVKVLDL